MRWKPIAPNKGSHFPPTPSLVLQPRQLKRPEDHVRLNELLAANQALTIVYVLKDELKQLWRQPSPDAAQNAWRAWSEKALASGIAPLVRFARKLEPYLASIVASASWRLNTSALEGINNRIKVIKRMACGYRDNAYFFLKIRAAFPVLFAYRRLTALATAARAAMVTLTSVAAPWTTPYLPSTAT